MCIYKESNIKYSDVVREIKPVSREMVAQAQAAVDSKTKPLGSLGRLEEVAVQMCLIQSTIKPAADKAAIFVFAGDHGITAEGVSAYPSEVTGQMVLNFLGGGAAINVLSRHNNIDLSIVDMGVNMDFPNDCALINKKIRKSTRNFAVECAMTSNEAIGALEGGMEVFFNTQNSKNINIIGLGEMGIGNTTSASAIISAVTGLPVKEAVGRGTGIDDKGLNHKAEIISKALDFHKPNSDDGLDILCKIGGYEIGGIAGAILAAASKGTAVVLDGVISTAAGLIAHTINPDIQGYLIAGHQSVEPAHKAALAHMNLRPLLNLDMRLGEGTGAALAINLVQASCRIMQEMATFGEAGVSEKDG